MSAHAPDIPTTATTAVLQWNLLEEPLIRWRSTEGGTLHRTSLPQLLAAMVGNEVRDFPALRPHQRHPWHAFLVQLGAIALHHAEHQQPWQTAADWRTALLALTPDDPDGAPWCLVAPADRPALLQAPVLKGIDSWDAGIHTPDRLDMIGTSKNHDLKRTRMKEAAPDDWLFALVSLQTQAGSNSGSYKGVSRMNSGAGSRPGIGIAQQGSWGQRWLSDLNALQRSRDAIAENYDFSPQGGLSLVWMEPWDESISIALRRLDPYYIEVCRRVRLEKKLTRILVRTTTTPVSRIQENDARKGRTGDPWTPIDKEDAKIMAVPRQGFRYELITKLLVLDGLYEPGCAQSLSGWTNDAKLELICQGIAPDGNSKTSGYHERRVPISPKLRRLLTGGQRPLVAALAKKRIQAIADMRKLLWISLSLLFANGENDSGNDTISHRASRFAQPFERHEDSRFFDDLTLHAEAEGEQQEAAYLQWLLGLAERAEVVLQQAFVAGPRSGMQRYKAQSAALSRFDAGLRAGKKPLFPELATHYAQQRTDRTTRSSASEGTAPCLNPPTAPLQTPPPIAPPVLLTTPPQQLSLL